MKCIILAAFVATLFPRAVYSAPVATSITDPGLGQSGYDSYTGSRARDELSTAGRSGYNSVGINSADTAGRSGYDSVGSVERKATTNADTDGRSGYN